VVPERSRRVDRDVAAWPKAVPVKDWMAQAVVTIRVDASCREAVELMKSHRIRHLPVVDPPRLVGIVTDRDLRQILFDPVLQDRMAEPAHDPGDRPVRDVMTWAVITVGPQTNIRQAARVMHEQKIGALPVVDAGRVVGILTEHDVLRAFAALAPGVTKVSPLEAPSTADEP
jgi:acetoin utilization protein AcuB